jgi:hypothetical protein
MSADLEGELYYASNLLTQALPGWEFVPDAGHARDVIAGLTVFGVSPQEIQAIAADASCQMLKDWLGAKRLPDHPYSDDELQALQLLDETCRRPAEEYDSIFRLVTQAIAPEVSSPDGMA